MEDDEDFEEIYELVMPFVVTKSHGGPYDDEAFCAGYEMGLMAGRFEGQVSQNLTIRTENVPQANLIAMKHGLSVIAEEDHDGGWTTLTLGGA